MRQMTEKDAEQLIFWYRSHKRDLPWRDTGVPEDVWISEIMLQQTRVEAVKSYFVRFRKALPDAAAIAACPEDRLLKLWEGLGYYSRVRNIKKCAEILVREHSGSLPADHAALLKLPGIGAYTAGAVASIAFGLPVPAVDGNVLRVFSRLTGHADDISLEATKKKFADEIEALILSCSGPSGFSGFSVSDFNQSLMELGAVVCLPNGAPLCASCPLRESCEARRTEKIPFLPVKGAKKPRKTEQRTLLVIRDGNRFLFRKRPEKGLLAGLYEFPGFAGTLSREEAVREAEHLGFSPLRVTPLPEGKHIFTHIEWHMTAWEITVAEFRLPENGVLPEKNGNTGSSPTDPSFRLVTGEELKDFAVPSAFRTWTDWYALREKTADQ